MTRFKYLLVQFAVLALCSASKAQSGFSLEFGPSYPRFMNHDLDRPSNNNYGGFLGLEGRPSLHTALRFQGKYAHLEGFWGEPENCLRTDAYSGSMDILYYLSPEESVSPYFAVGCGIINSSLDNYKSKTLGASNSTILFDCAVGAEYNLGGHWKMVTEFAYQITGDSKLDGALGETKEDKFISFDLGFKYSFCTASEKKAEIPVRLASGLRDTVDYARIERILKDNRAMPDTSENSSEENRWVLVGVNFETGSDRFTAESYPILFHAARVLLENPDTRVEIIGYTDNTGNATINKQISEKRAEAVKNYLMSKGVSGDRLQASGMGDLNPIGDNGTPQGRAMNRRIEFRIKK